LPGVRDLYSTVPQVDHGVIDGVLGLRQRRDRAVDLSFVDTVTERVVAKPASLCGEIVQNIRRAIYFRFTVFSAAQHVIEVLVSQEHVRHAVSGNLAHVVVDRLGFGERGAGVDEQRCRTASHQTDSDIQERQPTTMQAVGQSLPVEVHIQPGSSRDQAP
jgi:hypothetical protein